MRIVRDFPPLFDEIDARFHVRGKPIIFAWGSTIYNPMGITVEPALIVHEGVHGSRQVPDIEGWWRRYIDEPEFRLAEEIPAHVAEYRARLGDGNRHDRRRCLKLVVQRLAGPMYGRLISTREATALLKAAV